MRLQPRQAAKRAFWDAAVSGASSGTCRIGTDADGRSITMTPEQRDRGLYIVGKPGTGKTSLLQSLIVSDLHAGHGLAVINPEQGTFLERILPFVPEHRIQDVIYFDPLDVVHPISLNPLHRQPGADLELCIEYTLTVLQQLFDTSAATAPQTTYILEHIVRTLMQIPGSSLFDAERLLDKDDPGFRAWAVDQINDRRIREFWIERYPKLRSDAPYTLYSRLSRFLSSPFLACLSARSPALDFHALMASKSVLLFNLPDTLGERNRSLLGQFIVARFQQAITLRREDDPSQPPFYIYLDEFQTFSNSAVASYETMLSRGRKRRAPLILAHQYSDQLPEPLLRGILGTVSTAVVYAVGAFDDKRLGREVGAEPRSLQNQRKFHAHIRDDEGLHVVTTPRPLRDGDARIRDQIVAASRRFATAPAAPEPHSQESDRGPERTPVPDAPQRPPSGPGPGPRVASRSRRTRESTAGVGSNSVDPNEAIQARRASRKKNSH